MLTSDGRTTSIHRPELLCNLAKKTSVRGVKCDYGTSRHTLISRSAKSGRHNRNTIYINTIERL